MEIKKVGVIGAGTMGHGIAQVVAAKGIEVIMRDIDHSFLETGMAQVGKNFVSFLNK
jgi:3-hydroxybutyryl-CoA dehydrogenase